jgi:hypothetical protein
VKLVLPRRRKGRQSEESEAEYRDSRADFSRFIFPDPINHELQG